MGRRAQSGFVYGDGVNPLSAAGVVFEDGWNRQDFTRVREILADQLPLHVAGTTRTTNAAELESIVASWHAAFPDFRFDIHSITANDHVAAVHATLHGTHSGPWGGFPATGRSIAVEHAFFLRVEGGLIVEVWEILDQPTLEAQLARSTTAAAGARGRSMMSRRSTDPPTSTSP